MAYGDEFNGYIDINPNDRFAAYFNEGNTVGNIQVSKDYLLLQRQLEPDGRTVNVTLEDGGFMYNEDYSQRAGFGARNLVDKAYVDSKVAPATLQTVLNNGGFANDPSTGNSININLSGGGSFQSFNNSVEGKFGSLNHSYEHFNTDFTSGTSYLSFYIGSSNNGTFKILNRDVQSNKEVAIQLKPNEGLVYEGDYSADFVDRSLVDKEYVDNKVAPATLQSVLDNGTVAFEDAAIGGPSMAQIDLINKSVSFLLSDGAHKNNYFGLDQRSVSLGGISETGSSDIQMDLDEGSILMSASDGQGTDVRVKLKQAGSLSYGADYSSTFTSRSLVDKGYVDNAIANSSGGDFIPLTGTEVGKPLTGNVALSYANFISGSGDYQSRLEFVGDSSELFSSTPMFTNSVRVSSDAVVLRSDDLTGAGNSSEIYVRTGLIRIRTNGTGARGLTGDDDYTANITALDYVQKKYVDDAIANSTTPIEEIILAGSNGLTGKIRYEKRGEFMNIHVDITVGKLQVDESFSTILPFDLKTSFIIHPMITDIVNYFYTDIIIKTDGNELLFINKTDAVITGGLIKQSFVFALGAD